MLKPGSLRAHLTAATPELKRDPDKVSIYVRNGHLVAAGADTLSFEYRYILTVVVLDYAGNPDAVFVPLLAWLRIQQPEIMDNTALREKAVRFEVEYLNAETVDISIEIDLTEAVIIAQGIDPTAPETTKRFTVTHPAEPARVGALAAAEHWEVWVRDEKMAEWDFPVTEP